MATQRLTTSEDHRLKDLERHLLSFSNMPVPRDIPDPGLRRYLDTLPPRTAAELIGKIQEMRRALQGAMTALESAGYTLEAYCGLDDEQRSTPEWQAVREAWEACGRGPKYLLRYTRGSSWGVSAYPTYRAALEAAIDALETCEAYPDAIELEGGVKLVGRADLLRMWEDRHDPG